MKNPGEHIIEVMIPEYGNTKQESGETKSLRQKLTTAIEYRDLSNEQITGFGSKGADLFNRMDGVSVLRETVGSLTDKTDVRGVKLKLWVSEENINEFRNKLSEFGLTGSVVENYFDSDQDAGRRTD